MAEKGQGCLAKGTINNIKPWFFQFQGILGLHSPKKKFYDKNLIFQKGHCLGISHAKSGGNKPWRLFFKNKTISNNSFKYLSLIELITLSTKSWKFKTTKCLLTNRKNFQQLVAANQMLCHMMSWEQYHSWDNNLTQTSSAKQVEKKRLIKIRLMAYSELDELCF